MITVAVIMYAREMGARIQGLPVFMLVDLILAWIVMDGLVKIFGGM
jgi:hypothetical protein